MVRRYDAGRPVPPEVVDPIVRNGRWGSPA